MERKNNGGKLYGFREDFFKGRPCEEMNEKKGLVFLKCFSGT